PDIGPNQPGSVDEDRVLVVELGVDPLTGRRGQLGLARERLAIDELPRDDVKREQPREQMRLLEQPWGQLGEGLVARREDRERSGAAQPIELARARERVHEAPEPGELEQLDHRAASATQAA